MCTPSFEKYKSSKHQKALHEFESLQVIQEEKENLFTNNLSSNYIPSYIEVYEKNKNNQELK